MTNIQKIHPKRTIYLFDNIHKMDSEKKNVKSNHILTYFQTFFSEKSLTTHKIEPQLFFTTFSPPRTFTTELKR